MTKKILCPSCDKPMVREDLGSAIIDVCADGCHGLWFEAGELSKFDHQKKGFGPSLARAVAQLGSATPRDRASLDCPRCRTVMDEVPYELAQSVTIDECPKCQGLYLDAGDLGRLRDRPLTVSEQASAARHRRSRSRSRKRAVAQARGLRVVCDLALFSAILSPHFI